LATLLKESDPATNRAHDVDASVAAATEEGIQWMDPIRERYTAQNINQLALPGLVQLGAGSCRQRRQPGLTHASYADYSAFEQAASVERVLGIGSAARG